MLKVIRCQQAKGRYGEGQREYDEDIQKIMDVAENMPGYTTDVDDLIFDLVKEGVCKTYVTERHVFVAGVLKEMKFQFQATGFPPEYYYTKINAPNDNNGTPRRAYIVSRMVYPESQGMYVVDVIDEGYKGKGGVFEKYPYIIETVHITVTASEYNNWIRYGKSIIEAREVKEGDE